MLHRICLAVSDPAAENLGHLGVTEDARGRHAARGDHDHQQESHGDESDLQTQMRYEKTSWKLPTLFLSPESTFASLTGRLPIVKEDYREKSGGPN